ncbi:MAG: 50S ribosomal protein L4 [Anaerolineales bacterium]|nr:50S ribosomal protein L4 [Anaerolineales bacterium]
MKVNVLNTKGEKVKTTTLPPEIFEAPIKKELMHQALVRQLANARTGTHSTKSRGEVQGGGKKPWRQKGTGRARQGSRRAPNWVGGGKVHTPKPRDYSLRMPRKMRRAALKSALSVKAAAKQIIVLDELTLTEPKTREMAAIVKTLTGEETALILVTAENGVVEKSTRNLTEAKTLRTSYLNIRDLLGFDQLIIPMDALAEIKSHLGE